MKYAELAEEDMQLNARYVLRNGNLNLKYYVMTMTNLPYILALLNNQSICGKL